MKPTLLFLDDRSKRLHAALERFSGAYDVTLVCNVKECLRMLSGRDFDVVSLDHDLDGCDFEDPDSSNAGMEVVRYLEKTGWPENKPKPRFYIHSSNMFAAYLMQRHLSAVGLLAEWQPFGWKQYQRGAVAGAFDVIHVGYIRLLHFAKEYCYHLTVLMHDKPDQVFPPEVRKEILLGIGCVDDVIVYRNEEELTDLLQKFEVRFVGSDHEGKTSRESLPIETIYHVRDHPWSATQFKRMIAEKCQNIS